MKKGKKLTPLLDLHGYKKDQVFDAVDKFLLKYKSKNRVYIMPGRGTGVIKKEVINYLEQAHYPWSFETSPLGKENQGVIVVFMN